MGLVQSRAAAQPDGHDAGAAAGAAQKLSP